MDEDLAAQIKAEKDKRNRLKNDIKSQEAQSQGNKVSLVGGVSFDQDIYDSSDKFKDYVSEIELDNEHDAAISKKANLNSNRNSNQLDVQKLIDEARMDMDVDVDPFASQGNESKIIAHRENEYQARRRLRMLSPERVDAFKTPAHSSNIDESHQYSYSDAMRKTQLEREEQELLREISKKAQEKGTSSTSDKSSKKKRRWDVAAPEINSDSTETDKITVKSSKWDSMVPQSESESDSTEVEESYIKKKNRWDETPQIIRSETGYDSTPKISSSISASETPKRTRSRWDETPVMIHATSSMFEATPVGNVGMATPLISQINISETEGAAYTDSDLGNRNKYMTDEELDQLLPSEGYEILIEPAGYMPIRTPARKLMATPTPMAGAEGFAMQEEDRHQDYGVPKEIPGIGALPFFKQDDVQFFGKLLDGQEDESLDSEELKDRTIKKLLLKVKNGTPSMRKSAMRQITENARTYGAGPLFNNILPLLMAPSLEDQERHLLVKVIDRILYRLGDLVRPFTHKILVVIEPLLIDEDYYARVEGREIISNLSKAAGLATMIATMRPDIDHIDEYVRNTTARAFSVVASALGIPSLLPFLKAVCKSKKSWQARHTGIKIVQQLAILMGCAILPHLKHLVDCIGHGLEDEQQKVRTITALALAALAEAAAPYGIESFDSVLKPLWMGIRMHRGKGLAAFLKAIGFIIPLMDAEHANYYTREVMIILIREFQSPDEEMKKIVLKVVKQCTATDGVQAQYIIDEILPEFFKYFWVRRMALDKRNYSQVVETTVEIANKVGVSSILSRLVNGLKDQSEPFRKMVMETLDQIISALGTSDIDPRLEEQLMDGVLYAFQEQLSDDQLILNGFGTIINALGLRAQPYLQQITSALLWRLNNQNARTRQQAADLVSKIALVMKTCGEFQLMANIGVTLYEYLGEEYPEVLGSILGGLKAIVNVIGMTEMQPPIKDLLPRLTPILKNRHEKVQENCIDLVGRIADRGAEYVSAREWMRICFELLELLKAHKKAIRRASVNTFGYIAKAIGPQDVLATLLNNLKVQERQNRVCTTVAIAIVAESCAPYTVLPALMNEYRVPELNVQNGVLKSMSFLFEYIGEMGKDYINAVTPLLEDALIDRDLVHRQQAASTIKHIALGVVGLGCETAVLHLLNYLWPNILETSPHLIVAVLEAIEACRVCLGPGIILNYVLQGIFHPARRIRLVYWRIYNMMYMGCQPAMVSCYPRIEDDEQNLYQRCELDYIL
ncbi:Splicing factor 3B subunit 1 [Smittium culicis]|uniref:Splicing factor 3B subunit 1 n=1 Tax=Smittium culicis TaxID=133412 RepID=A0A1R1X915_9FUNG|nr:Splicing factor 3B subunit 1 [Smittium culicis]OMJ25346.1 Splicing factor 3B subunit 1 [Smittium culicis]